MNKQKITIKIDKELLKMVEIIKQKHQISTVIQDALKFYLTNIIQFIPAIQKYKEWYIQDWWDD